MRKLFLVFFLLIFSSNIIKATHLMGGEITYQCLDSSNRIYKVKMSLYRDCCGIQMYTWSINAVAEFENGCPNMNIAMSYKGKTEVTPICAPQQTTCTGGPCNSSTLNIGFERCDYEGVVQLPFGCGLVTFFYDDCCRNTNGGSGTISSIDFPKIAFHIQTKLNPYLSAGNNSTKFSKNVTPNIFNNKKHSYNFYATDPDGDSLYYEFYTPFNAAADPVIWKPFYSANRPFDMVEPQIILNNNTGQFEFTPITFNPIQAFIMGYKISEYRRLKSKITGLDSFVFAGAIFRDIQNFIRKDT
jgi:hypothetical protein